MDQVKPENKALEEIDKLLAEEDPNFNASLESIKKEAVDNTTEIESLDVDMDSEGSERADREENTNQPSLKKKVLNWLFSPFTKLKNWLNLRWVAARNRLTLFLKQTYSFFKNDYLPFVF